MLDNNNTYVFRLQNDNGDGNMGLVNTLKHWDSTHMYDDNQINTIDSSNINTLKEPTSIPSPFARIALAKTAFAEVAAYGEKSLSSYQKIVSNCLDVAEIFFTFEKWKDKIEIIKWNYGRNDGSLGLAADSDLLKLAKNNKQLYKTLKTFLENDAQTYNFDRMKCIYILKYKSTGEMIGATSPATLFFSSANKFEKEVNGNKISLSPEIPLSNNHCAFDGIFPLCKRSWDFQKYLYTWFAVNDESRNINGRAATSIFQEFSKYLGAQKPLIERTQDINALVNNKVEDLQTTYRELRAPDVEILGKPLYQVKYEVNKNYAYLNVNDLLEDTIIRLPNKIQNTAFFDGNLNKNGQYGYLLPLKEEFFKHFTNDDVSNFIKINEAGNVVEVELKITDSQLFKKIYRESDSIKKLEDFDCLLFPNVKFIENKDAYYRFGLFLKYELKNQANYTVDFFAGSNKLLLADIDSITRNVNDAGNALCKIYALNQKTFDRIAINVGNVRGILIPALPIKNSSEQFTFSVDFGTTNTHIEYKTSSDNTIKPFEVAELDKQVNFLSGNDESFYSLISDIDFIPIKLGLGEKFKFPIRTALSLAKNRDKSKKVYPFVQANIVIPFEKRQIPFYNETLTQLKWESDEDQMSYFIDSLCFILRNKVSINNGDLSATKIVWFYPLSMAGSRSKTIENIWKRSYAKYFLGISVNNADQFNEKDKEILSENLKKLPESIAPYLCYKDETKYKDAISNLVSIDIGGGTTDVVFVKDRKVEYVTSFRFAANSIFGLGEHITPVISKYKSDIESIIKQNDNNFKLENLYKSINNSKFGDLASFFFSLSDNEMLKNVEVDFNSMLKRDENQKLVFVMFYSSIIYHTAQIMKAKDLPLPRHITFSGNGSRIVNIVADSKVLIEFSKLIFEKVYDQSYGNSGLGIIHNTVNPKEVTCKGGIKAADNNYTQSPFEPVVLLGTDDTTFVADNLFYNAVNIEEYATKTNIQVKAFFDFVIDDLLNKKYTKDVVPETFIKALGLNPKTLNIAREVCARDEDFKTFTTNGIRDKMKKVDVDTTQIEESFFFYPIIGLLNTLSNEINNIN